MIRRRVVVRGTVQGVFFRASCEQEVRRVGVSGWVANCPDDSVEAVFEGTDEAVEQMINWCKQGPPHATVTSVDVGKEAPLGESGFTVR